MKLTLWGTPRPSKLKLEGWQCSRPDCTKRRAPNHRYCRECRAAYERMRTKVTREMSP